jgi:H+/Cl- antiporter ClcA
MTASTEKSLPQFEKPSVSAYGRLVLLGAGIGIPASLLAAGFLFLIHELQHFLWGEATPPWYLILGLPIVGAVVTIIARKFLPGDGGSGPLDHSGIGGKLEPRFGFGIALAAIGSLAFGIVLGPEAPLIALGAVAGMSFLPFAKFNTQEKAVVSTAGSFAAVSAVFGGPIVAGVLMMEGALGMGTAIIPILLPGFVAAAIGYTIVVGLGDWAGIHVTGLTVPALPPYQGTYFIDLALAVGLGIVAAFLIFLVRRYAHKIYDFANKNLNLTKSLLLGGLLLGLIVLVASFFGINTADVFFSGQNSLPALAAISSIKILFILLIAKSLAYIVSLAFGFRGGPIFPAIFLGVALAMVASIFFGVSPTWAIAVGAAAGIAAMTKTLLTAILFASLLVGPAGSGAISAAVLAAAAAWFTVVVLERKYQALG